MDLYEQQLYFIIIVIKQIQNSLENLYVIRNFNKKNKNYVKVHVIIFF